jgi:hypothetical protein
MSEYDVLWPRAPRTAPVGKLAARPASLEGRKVAFLWDYLFRGDEIFPILEDELRKAHPGVTFVGYQEFGTTHGEGEHELLASLGKRLEALEVDAVISGMGC